jgi:ubiquinone/menaquinone biosynthesis C-methylase UbiE
MPVEHTTRASMSASDSFHDFELAGWSSPSVVAAYHDHVAELTKGCIAELLRAAAVTAADQVLDVGCGAGYVAAAARELGAVAVGIDFSPAQIKLAEASYPGIRFIPGDAQALPFPDGEFEVVLNGFGLPHVRHPDKAAAEAHRVLAPAGRFAYASWCEASKCIAFELVYDAIRSHGSLDVGLPPGPNFFACGTPSLAREMLARAGFANVSMTEVPLVWRAASADEFIDVISSGTVRAAATLKRQSAESLAKIRQYLNERIAPFPQDGGYRIPAPALVVSADKPN